MIKKNCNKRPQSKTHVYNLLILLNLSIWRIFKICWIRTVDRNQRWEIRENARQRFPAINITKKQDVLFEKIKIVNVPHISKRILNINL